MPNPLSSAVHISGPLTNLSIGWKQDQTAFVADQVFPVIPVQKQFDQYFVYDRGDFRRGEMKKRAPGTESAGGDYRLSTAAYACDVWALHKDVDDQTRANEDAAINGDRDAVDWLNEQAMISKEVNFATTYMTDGVWTFEADGVASGETAPGSFDPEDGANNNKRQWNDPASTPIEDVRQAKLYVEERTGRDPNTFTLSKKVYNSLVDHPDLIDRIKYGQTSGGPAMTTRQAMAAMFDVNQILVASGSQNTAAELATEANSFIVGKHALLTYRPPSPGLRTVSAGYTFAWNGYLGASSGALQISKFRMDVLKSDRIEGELAYDQKLVSADCGYFFDGIIA